MLSTSQLFMGSISANASRYPLITHWIVESVLWRSTASVGSDTFTTVASSWDKNDPRIATAATFQMSGDSFPVASSAVISVSGKCRDHFLCRAHLCQAREDRLYCVLVFFHG